MVCELDKIAFPDNKLTFQELLTIGQVSDFHFTVGSAPSISYPGRGLVPLPKSLAKGPSTATGDRPSFLHRQTKVDPLSEEFVEQIVRGICSDKEYEVLLNNKGLDLARELYGCRFRVSIRSAYMGFAVTMRKLPSKIMSISDIGFPTSVYGLIATESSGLILVTGSTSSGKSTTLTSIVDGIIKERAIKRSGSAKLITLEDPIEALFRSYGSTQVVQRQVGLHVASFEQGVKDSLRDKPDIIYVGELRDKETIRAALTAASTGHLVLSTYHGESVPNALQGICSRFSEGEQLAVRHDLATYLRFISYQKILPREGSNGVALAMEYLFSSHGSRNQIQKGNFGQLYNSMLGGSGLPFDKALIGLKTQKAISEEVYRTEMRLLQAIK